MKCIQISGTLTKKYSIDRETEPTTTAIITMTTNAFLPFHHSIYVHTNMHTFKLVHRGAYTDAMELIFADRFEWLNVRNAHSERDNKFKVDTNTACAREPVVAFNPYVSDGVSCFVCINLILSKVKFSVGMWRICLFIHSESDRSHFQPDISDK